LGDEVIVSRVSCVEYDSDDHKRLTRTDAVTPFRCTVVGSVKRAIGKYMPGRDRFSFYGPDTDVPARLEVARYIRLYKCKTRLEGKSFLVHPDDIEVLEHGVAL
jgi:hypothetical protein